jgi:hypothetical protein
MIMKKIFILVLLLAISLFSFAQYGKEEEKERGFKRDQLYLGSGINVGFSQGWVLGLNPEVGYSLNNFLDAGIATNINYITQNLGSGYSYKFLAFGGGPFVRGWIINQFFITGQFEFNRISEKYKDPYGTVQSSYTSPSVLVGAGYGSRQIGRSQFFTSIMVDVLRNPKSPYVDRQTNTILPVFRTGFMFYLRPQRER